MLAFLALLLTGCPDTERGEPSSANTSDSGTDSGSGAEELVWRQTLDFTPLEMLNLRGPLRFTAEGSRAYVPSWESKLGLTSVTDGLLSEPTALVPDICNPTDIQFRPDEQVAFVSSYYKWGCNSVTSVTLNPDGTLQNPLFSGGFTGETLTFHEAPDFVENLVLHPSGAWLYVGFANHHPTTEEVVENSQIGRVDIALDGTLSNDALFDLDAGDTRVVTLGLTPPGDVLYAVQYDIGKVNRLTVDPINGALGPAGVATVSQDARIGPICVFGGKEHVYVGSQPEDATGGVHHLQFNGAVLEASSATGMAQHPGLLRVHSLIANKDCTRLYVAGERVNTQAVLHIFTLDPDTGAPTWKYALDDVPSLVEELQLSLSPDERFLYAAGRWQPLVHTFEIVTH